MEAVATRLSEVHQEARAALDHTKQDHCPWCKENPQAHAEVMADEYAYCHHLLGFVNLNADGERPATYEPTRPLIRYANGQPYDSGFKVTGGSAPMPRDAVLVNPVREQEVGGVVYKARLWASWRVYRKAEEKKDLILPATIPLTGEALLEQEVKQLEKKLAKQALQKRRDELRKELEAAELAELEEATKPEQTEEILE